MSDERSANFPEIPFFADCRQQAKTSEELLILASRCADALRGDKEPLQIRRKILEFQQGLLSAKSERALKAIRFASENNSGTAEEREREEEAEDGALTIFYEALLDSPYEADVDSADDRDLWRQAAIWRRTRHGIPIDELREERRLLKRLKQLAPQAMEEETPMFSPAGSRRRQERFLLYADDLAAEADEREKCFLELLKLRQRLAERAGFAHYRAYSAFASGPEDFNRRDENQFFDLYQQQFAPLCRQVLALRSNRLPNIGRTVYDLPVMNAIGDPMLRMAEGDFFNKLSHSLKEIIDSESNYLSALIEKGYYSSSESLAADLSGSALLLPSFPAAFLLLPFRDSRTNVLDLFRRCGRALADISAMLNYHSMGSFPQDALGREISALVFLCLSRAELADYFEFDADLVLELFLSRELLHHPLRLAWHSFENYVYSGRSSLHIHELNSVWRQIERNWLSFLDYEAEPFFSKGRGWQAFLAASDRPLRSLASVQAFITVFAEHPFYGDKLVLKSKLNRLLLSNPADGIASRLRTAEFFLPHDEEAVRRAAFSLCDFLAL